MTNQPAENDGALSKPVIAELLRRPGDREAPSVVTAFDSFLDLIGGEQKLGEALYADFQHARGQGLTEEQRRKFVRRDATVARFHKLIFDYAASSDERRHGHQGGVREEDVLALFREMALELSSAPTEQQIHRAMLERIAATSPGVLQEFIEARESQPALPEPTTSQGAEQCQIP